MTSDGTCTMAGSTPSAAPSVRAIWSQVSTSSEVMWNASPTVRECPSNGTNARAKSALWVTVHSEVPSPCMITGRPARIRARDVHPPCSTVLVAS